MKSAALSLENGCSQGGQTDVENMGNINFVKIRKKVVCFFAELKGYLYYVKPAPQKQVRLVLWGQGRSGSTLIESLIHSAGHFKASGELLNTATRGEIRFPYHYISGLSKKNADSNFIFHLKIYQLTRDRKRPVDSREFLSILQRDGWKIVYLRRRNKVKQVLSNLVSRHRGTPFKLNDEPERIRLLVDCGNFVSLVNERLRFEEEELRALEGLDFHEVIYEDDLEEQEMQQDTISKILSFLSLEDQKVHSRFRKVNKHSLKELIINYDEFAQCIVLNGWQDYLEE